MIKTTKQSSLVIKTSLCFTFLVIWIIYRLKRNSADELVVSSFYCFRDRYLIDYIYPITRFLSQNLHIRDLFLITGSNSLDVLMLSYVALYVKIGNSWRGILNLVLFYGIRGVIQNHITLNYYHTYLYTEPAFFSIFVPVFKSPDFFWSGHCGITLIGALQFRNWGYKKTFYIGLLISFWEGVVMTSLRAHYSIDIIFGWLIAHHNFWMADIVADIMDKRFNIFGKQFDSRMSIEFKKLQVSGIEESKIEEIKSKSDFKV